MVIPIIPPKVPESSEYLGFPSYPTTPWTPPLPQELYTNVFCLIGWLVGFFDPKNAVFGGGWSTQLKEIVGRLTSFYQLNNEDKICKLSKKISETTVDLRCGFKQVGFQSGIPWDGGQALPVHDKRLPW